MTNQSRNHRIIIAAVAAGVILLFVLRAVFSGAIILPRGFHLGLLVFRYYGLILALAIVAAYSLAAFRAPVYRIKSGQLDRVVLILIVSGFWGARLYHVATEFGYYRHNWGQIFAVWHGGLSIFGAILGGIVGLALARSRLGQSSLLKLLDWLAPSVLLGQIIGRFGNLFNYELFGYPTSLPWKMFVPLQFRPFDFFAAQFFHPLFLYEALLNGLFLFILLKVVGSARRAGTLFFSYLFLYNAGRFFLEYLRPNSILISGLRLNGLVSACLALLGLGGLIYFYYASPTTPHS